MADGRSEIEYEIVCNTETVRVIVPSDWKVTFGDVMPGTRGEWRGPGMPRTYCLRMYESENKQRMLFNDVLSFRDTSVSVKRKDVTRVPNEDGDVWVNGNEVIEWNEVE